MSDRLTTTIRWVSLAALTAIFASAMQAARLPAALFLGPLIAGIVFGARGIHMHVPRKPNIAAMAIVGTMVGNLTNAASVEIFLRQWPLFIAVILATSLSSSLIGYAMTRMRILPGSVAIWGTTTGASIAMILLAETQGADPRLVAFMHYLRVLVAAALSALLARYWLGAGPGTVHQIAWFPPIHWVQFIETLAVTAVAGVIGTKLRLPGGMFLGPVVAVTLLKGFGIVEFELPRWLLTITYAFIGWGFGLNFTKEILLYTLRVLPQILAAICLMILAGIGLAAILVYAAGIDPVTAYLATSPGSTDSVAIIAADSKAADASFVMAMQIMRMFFLMFLAPTIASYVAKLAMRHAEG